MQAQKATLAELSIRLPDGSTRLIPLELDRYEIGRGDFNALCFPGVEGLSRQHLALERNGFNWLVRDAGSTNGTFVNGARISEPRILRSKDRVTAGALSMTFSEAAPLRPDPSSQTILFIEKSAAPPAAAVETTLEGVLKTDQQIQNSPHMRALIAAGRELCGQSSLETLFDVIMHLAVDAVGAARGVLITLEEGEFRVRASKGAGFRISSHVRDLVVQKRRSLLVQDALRDEILSGRMSIVQDQVRGILAVPLQTEDRVIGLIYLDSPVLVREFTKDDLSVLTVLANIAAIRIEQARLAEIEQAEKLRARELEHAAQIQRSILPAAFPPFPHRKDFQLHAAMVPAKEVGGDLFDFFLLDDEHLGFVIGDVSGKGVPAALFMAMTRTLLRATARHQTEPGKCLNTMNAMLAEGNTPGMFVTIFYGVLNTRTGNLDFANAGHNPPYLLSPDGKLQRLSEISGPMLGLFQGREYRTLTTQIAAGDAMILYTDGVTEAINKSEEFFDDQRLEECLASHATEEAQALVMGLHATVQEFAKGMPQADDITVLGLRYVGSEAAL